MPSPFPGMDPFIEDAAYWPDFHARFVTYWCDAINEVLPDGYDARIDERVRSVEVLEETAADYRPDVTVSANPLRTPASQSARDATATLEPVTVPLPHETEVRETAVHLYRLPDRELIAVLELLSPSNKRNPGRSDYLAKRAALRQQSVHIVELDLLLDGQRLPLGGPYPHGDYYLLVSRADRRPDCEVYAWTIRDLLPRVPVPLAQPDGDVLVSLAEVFDLAYERGRYRRLIDYRGSLSATIDRETALWIEQRLAAEHT